MSGTSCAIMRPRAGHSHASGFAPTPASIQVNPDPKGGAPQLTGTGNVTSMLPRGYIEILFKTADTTLGREFDSAMARYAGVQLAAFAWRMPPGHTAALPRMAFAYGRLLSCSVRSILAPGQERRPSRLRVSSPPKCRKGAFEFLRTTLSTLCGSRAGSRTRTARLG